MVGLQSVLFFCFVAANRSQGTTLVGQHRAIADLPLLHFLDGVIRLGHGESLCGCVHAVPRRYIQHLAQLVRAADGASAD